MKRAARITRPMILLSAALLVLMIGAAGILFYIGVGPIDFEPASRNLGTAALDYRNAGWPWEADEVDNIPRPAPKDDATVDLQGAVETLNQSSEEQSGAGISLEDMEDYKGLRKLLASYSRTLDLAVKAAERPCVWIHHDWDMGIYIAFPEFPAERAIVHLLVWRAECEVHDGDTKDGCRDLAAAERIAGFSGQEPTLVSGLTQITADMAVLSGFVRCADDLEKEPAALKQLGSCFKPAPDLGFPYYLRSEAYMGLALLRNADSYGGIDGLIRAFTRSGNLGDEEWEHPIDPTKLRRTGLPDDLKSRAFLDRTLSYWAKVGAMLRASPNDPASISHQMETALREIERQPSLSNYFVSISSPVFDQAGEAFMEDRARQIVTGAFLAAMVLHAQTGHFPIRISDLSGKWIDPFTGAPLRIRNIEGEFRIYSLGPTRKDYGGIDRAELAGRFGLSPSLDYNIPAVYPPDMSQGMMGVGRPTVPPRRTPWEGRRTGGEAPRTKS